MSADALDDFVPIPEEGRTFTGTATVRIDSCAPDGTMRADGVVRAMQDLSADDTADSRHGGDGWVVRRTAVRIDRPARYRERLALTTFCGGTGRCWAERRVSMAGDRGAAIEGKSLWVHIDPETGRPRALPERFMAVYGAAAAGRRVKARLVHPPPGDDLQWRAWSFRYTDADMWGHVNNAAVWTAAVDVIARSEAAGALVPPLLASVEHGPAIDPTDPVETAVATAAGYTMVWLRVGEEVRASARFGRR